MSTPPPFTGTPQNFKTEDLGETVCVIKEGPYKGYKVIVQTIVKRISVEGLEADGKTPEFRTWQDCWVRFVPPLKNVLEANR